MPYLQSPNFGSFDALCTDDIKPANLLKNGHMDRLVREMMSHGWSRRAIR